MKKPDISFIQKVIGYTFKNKQLLIQAFTHSSFSNEHNESPSYERLEFLGDAAIGYIIAEELYKKYSDIDEGRLSKARAMLVSWQTMCEIVDGMNIIEFLQVGNGDIKRNVIDNDNIKCDLFEAIAGAIIADNDFKILNCKKYVLRFFTSKIEEIENKKTITDYKSMLLEDCAKENKKVEFSSNGQQGDKQFIITLKINGEKVAEGKGNTKKQAEKNAAKAYFNQLQK